MVAISFRACRIALLGVFLWAISSASQAAFVTGLSDTQIQNVLENYFPLSEYAASARVSLHQPKARLQKDNKKIVLIIPLVAKITGGTVLRGHATIQVELAYKALTGGVYFSKPYIQQFDVPRASNKMRGVLHDIVAAMVENSLPVVRIYTVKERELNHSLSKSTLKSTLIENGRLRLEFGFK